MCRLMLEAVLRQLIWPRTFGPSIGNPSICLTEYFLLATLIETPVPLAIRADVQ